MCSEREPHLFGGVCLLRRGTMLKYQCRQGNYDTYGKYKAIFFFLLTVGMFDTRCTFIIGDDLHCDTNRCMVWTVKTHHGYSIVPMELESWLLCKHLPYRVCEGDRGAEARCFGWTL